MDSISADSRRTPSRASTIRRPSGSFEFRLVAESGNPCLHVSAAIHRQLYELVNIECAASVCIYACP